MKQCALLLLVCAAVVCVLGSPLPTMTPGSCTDAVTLGAAAQALTKINEHRKEGFIFSLERLSNVNQMQQGEMGTVFDLLLDVLETKCHVLSRKSWKSCEVRSTDEIPVYGRCKARIYINRVQRVSNLYTYTCTVRPAPATKIHAICPDCPSLINKDEEDIAKTVQLSMEKFNKESGLSNYFAPLKVTRASAQMGMGTFYFAQFTIQETVCANTTDIAEASKCQLVDCEFSHKGHCQGSHSHSHGEEFIDVECEIFEPEAAEEAKKEHLLGGELDHSHSAAADLSLAHDHAHDHTHGHAHGHTHDGSHNHTHDNHEAGDAHHHAHDHTHGHAHGHTHDGSHNHTHDNHEAGDAHHHVHDHAHSHDHGHDHDHGHAHHAKAHDHSADRGAHVHHHYGHGKDETHAHDHEHALDHEHKHGHLHGHEHHHHHHHEHKHEAAAKGPEGTVRVLASMDAPMILPSFPDEPAAEADRPVTWSAQCPGEGKSEGLVKELFAEDPLFKL